jgi:hypothetical protein
MIPPWQTARPAVKRRAADGVAPQLSSGLKKALGSKDDVKSSTQDKVGKRGVLDSLRHIRLKIIK